MRKFSAGLVLLTTLIMITGCEMSNGNPDKWEDDWFPTLSEADYAQISLEEAITSSDCAVLATCGAYERGYGDTYIYYAMDVEQTLYGYVPNDDINVLIEFTEGMEHPFYDESHEYLLLLNYMESPLSNYTGEEEYYAPVTPRLLLVLDPESGEVIETSMYGESVEIPEDMSLADYVLSVKEESGLPDLIAQKEAFPKRNGYEDSYEEIAGESQLVVYAKLDSLQESYNYYENTWLVTVKEVVFGDEADLNYLNDKKQLQIVLTDAFTETQDKGKTFLIPIKNYAAEGEETVYGMSAELYMKKGSESKNAIAGISEYWGKEGN